MKRNAFAMTAIGLCALAAPASAQIIATSIPREEAAGTGKGVEAGEKKFALHLMGAPLSKWRYNELIGGVVAGTIPVGNQTVPIVFVDSGVFTGNPNSDFLLAGEMAFKLGSDWSVGVGGWYNKVGKVTYEFDLASALALGSGFVFNSPPYPAACANQSVCLDQVKGTLDGDLKVSEGHVNLFYKNVGIQAGLVHTTSKINNSNITVSVNNLSKPGTRLGSVEGDENKATDWDLYGVYKFSGGDRYPWGVSLGAGIYKKKGNEESGQRLASDQTVFSGFITASLQVFKGLGIDASYWHVGKTEASRGESAAVTSDAASRFTIGVGYSFSK